MQVAAGDISRVRDLTPGGDATRAQIAGLSPRRPDVVPVGLNDRYGQ